MSAGHFQFCVDLGLPANQTALSQHREMNALVQQVADLFARHEIAATWATPQSVDSPVVDIPLSADERHEIALLGDESWLSSSIRREEIVGHFNEGMQRAVEFHRPIKSLVLRDDAPESLYVFFKKRGIDVLRPVMRRDFAHQPQREPGLRINDMWITHATGVFPACGHLLGRFDVGYRGKQILNRSRGRGMTEQLSVVVSRMMENPTSALRALDRILRYTAKFRDTGAVTVETLAETTRRWQPQRSTSQRSVLRPAA